MSDTFINEKTLYIIYDGLPFKRWLPINLCLTPVTEVYMHFEKPMQEVNVLFFFCRYLRNLFLINEKINIFSVNYNFQKEPGRLTNDQILIAGLFDILERPFLFRILHPVGSDEEKYLKSLRSPFNHTIEVLSLKSSEPPSPTEVRYERPVSLDFGRRESTVSSKSDEKSVQERFSNIVNVRMLP